LQYTVATVIRDALQEYQLTTIQIYAKFSSEPHRRYCMTCQPTLQKLFKIEILSTDLPSLVEKIPASLSIGKGAGMMSFSTKRGNKSSEQVLWLTEHPGGPAGIVCYYTVATGVRGGVGTSARLSEWFEKGIEEKRNLPFDEADIENELYNVGELGTFGKLENEGGVRLFWAAAD
jgi:hypothetical protein